MLAYASAESVRAQLLRVKVSTPLTAAEDLHHQPPTPTTVEGISVSEAGSSPLPSVFLAAASSPLDVVQPSPSASTSTTATATAADNCKNSDHTVVEAYRRKCAQRAAKHRKQQGLNSNTIPIRTVVSSSFSAVASAQSASSSGKNRSTNKKLPTPSRCRSHVSSRVAGAGAQITINTVAVKAKRESMGLEGPEAKLFRPGPRPRATKGHTDEDGAAITAPSFTAAPPPPATHFEAENTAVEECEEGDAAAQAVQHDEDEDEQQNLDPAVRPLSEQDQDEDEDCIDKSLSFLWSPKTAPTRRKATSTTTGSAVADQQQAQQQALLTGSQGSRSSMRISFTDYVRRMEELRASQESPPAGGRRSKSQLRSSRGEQHEQLSHLRTCSPTTTAASAAAPALGASIMTNLKVKSILKSRAPSTAAMKAPSPPPRKPLQLRRGVVPSRGAVSVPHPPLPPALSPPPNAISSSQLTSILNYCHEHAVSGEPPSPPRVTTSEEDRAERLTGGILHVLVSKSKQRGLRPATLCPCVAQPLIAGTTKYLEADYTQWVKHMARTTSKHARNCPFYRNPARLQAIAKDLIEELTRG